MGEIMESGGADSDSDVEFVSSTLKPSNGVTNKSGLVVIEKVDGKNLSEKDKLGLSEDYYKGLNSYVCEGCDRRFFQLSLFIQHICRITSYTAFNCLDCGTKLTFSNMCRLKRHINEHKRYNNKVNKANMDDMVVELPDLDDFQKVFSYNFKENNSALDKLDQERSGECWECSTQVNSLKVHYLNRKTFQLCEVCSLMLPNKCALAAHIRVHKQESPHICPDCGKIYITFTGLHHHLLTQCLHQYRCIRYKCPLCVTFLPSERIKLHEHMRGHCRTIFDCSLCDSSFEELTKLKAHLQTHEGNIPPLKIIHRCPMCFKMLAATEMDIHLEGHITNEMIVYSLDCPSCRIQTTNTKNFRDHVEENGHYKMPFWDEPSVVLVNYPPAEGKRKTLCFPISKEPLEKPPQPGTSCQLLPPNACRFCSRPVDKASTHLRTCKDCLTNTVSCRCAICGMTLRKVNSIIEYHLINVHNIKAKKDFSGYLVGPRRRAPNPTSQLPDPSKKAKSEVKQDSRKPEEPKPTNPLACRYCETIAGSKEELRKHYPSHREEAQFQCLECGECFVSCSSLSIHLVSVHSISDAKAYVSSNDVHTLPQEEPPPPLKENQCSECHSEFPDAKSLQMHFRSHGLAFLRQNMNRKPVTLPPQKEDIEKGKE